MYKIALAGCGRISRNHIDAIEKLKEEGLAQLVACCDIIPERANQVADKTGATAFLDHEKMLSETDCELVSLCTPSGLHPHHAIAAAKAGRNILSEKPLGCSLSSCDEAICTAGKARVHYLVVKQNRFNPSIRLLRQAFEKGRFGRVFMILANVLWTRPQSYYDEASWRGTREFDGGCLSNQASHYVDLVQWFGGEVDSVVSQLSTQKIKMECEDSISVSIKFKTGAIGNINATVLTYPKNLEGSITIIGEHGTVRIGGIALNKIERWEFDSYDDMDKQAEISNTNPDSVYGFGHLPYYRHVINVLAGKESPLCTACEARKTVEIIESAYAEEV